MAKRCELGKVKVFSLVEYVQQALHQARYESDENGMIIAYVPGCSGFFAQGETFEEARENLQDVMEGNVLLALQMGWDLPVIEGVSVQELAYAETKAADQLQRQENLLILAGKGICGCPLRGANQADGFVAIQNYAVALREGL
ncbi:MAG TPA: type II toxin-antitoxin system HicB family antitoxin [Armatimonadetes bacterium]|nr:type II toxin-antitoxin system HicB family antitoxin [Armatimonadota bacterium]